MLSAHRQIYACSGAGSNPAGCAALAVPAKAAAHVRDREVAAPIISDVLSIALPRGVSPKDEEPSPSLSSASPALTSNAELAASSEHNDQSDKSVKTAPTSSLQAWFKDHINGLYAVHDQSGSDLFSETFADDASISMDDKKIDLAQFKEDVVPPQFIMSVTVEWGDDLKITDATRNGGTISGSYIVKRQSIFRVRAGPAYQKQQVVFTANMATSSSSTNNSDTSLWRIVSFSGKTASH